MARKTKVGHTFRTSDKEPDRRIRTVLAQSIAINLSHRSFDENPIGYNIVFENSIETPSILMLSVHPSREKDLMRPNNIQFDPPISAQTYTDHFGNICTRIVMPPGSTCSFG